MLHSLRLSDFRCFPSLDLEVGEEGVILLGDNGQGKTSVLEAVCVLIRLHSPRTHRFGVMARHGGRQFGIAGNPWGAERKVIHQADGLELSADGETSMSRSAYLADGGLLVWMGNEDLDLIRGPGEGRRRFLDFIGSQIDPGYRRSLSRYRRALAAKNLLLRNATPRMAEILSYEEILVEHGSHLNTTRQRIVRDLAPLAAGFQQSISGTKETLDLTYLPANGPDLRESILQARERETRLRQAVVGPHRDDLSLRLQAMPAADFASEGQQRTIALALKLAQGALLEQCTRRVPIYLLDDIFGELDPSRRNALMAHLPRTAQKWITTTRIDWLNQQGDLGNLTRFTVRNGTCG